MGFDPRTFVDPAVRDGLAAVVEAVRAGAPPGLDAASDFGFDASFVARTAPLLEWLWRRYFRVTLQGMEHIPADGPALIVANHSGGLPYDGAMLIHAFHRHQPGHPAGDRPLRPLVASFAFRSSWIAPVIARIGGVRASAENALAILARGGLVGVFPEGLRGVGKLFERRYHLARFGRGGFVRLARAAQVPIVPVAIVGAEETHPVLARLTTLARPLGLPYIPVTPTFPWFGPLGLLPVPTKWTIRLGEAIPPPAPVTDDPNENQYIADLVRARMESMLADILSRRRSIIFG
jgi:1-acyl-sn-glycerol-3-phosphate acyltransferase